MKTIFIIATIAVSTAFAANTPTTQNTNEKAKAPAAEAERGTTTDIYGNGTRPYTQKGKNAVGNSKAYRSDTGTQPGQQDPSVSKEGQGSSKMLETK